MELFAAFLLFILIGMMIMGMVFYRQAKKVNKEKNYALPNLGMKSYGEEYDVAVKHLLQHLAEAYPKNYHDWVQERVIREHYISLIEFENRWFEWQRFLIMAALLKTAPMYSEEIDVVWHEMLMFTREYEEFSNRYLKTTLHHAPNIAAPDEQPIENNPSKSIETPQQQRAWFDLIYLLLFEPTPYSVTVLGPFLRHPVAKTVIEDFKTFTPEELEKKYFHTNVIQHFAFMQEIVHQLIEQIQSMIEKIESHVDVHGTDMKRFRLNTNVQPKNNHPLENHLLGNIFLAIYYQDQFVEQNRKWYKEKLVK